MNSRYYDAYLIRNIRFITPDKKCSIQVMTNTCIRIDPETHSAYVGVYVVELHKLDYVLVC